MLLVTEMALFMLLVLPMPFAVRRKIFTYVQPPPLPLSPHWLGDTELLTWT